VEERPVAALGWMPAFATIFFRMIFGISGSSDALVQPDNSVNAQKTPKILSKCFFMVNQSELCE
jgi:hypothetical protein